MCSFSLFGTGDRLVSPPRLASLAEMLEGSAVLSASARVLRCAAILFRAAAWACFACSSAGLAFGCGLGAGAGVAAIEILLLGCLEEITSELPRVGTAVACCRVLSKEPSAAACPEKGSIFMVEKACIYIYIYIYDSLHLFHSMASIAGHSINDIRYFNLVPR